MFLFSNRLLYKNFSIARFAFLFSSVLSFLGTLFYEHFQSVYVSLFAYFLSFFVSENIALQLKGGIIDVSGFYVSGKSRKELYFDYLLYRIGYMGVVGLTAVIQLIIHVILDFPPYIPLLAFVIYLLVTMPLVISVKRNTLSSQLMPIFVLLFYLLLYAQLSVIKHFIRSNLNIIDDVILVLGIILLCIGVFSFSCVNYILNKHPFVSREIQKKHERWN